jgi:hypothetical protein
MIYNRIAIYRIEPHVIRNWSHQTTCAGELNVKKQTHLVCKVSSESTKYWPP